jgi:hypothetical protein
MYKNYRYHVTVDNRTNVDRAFLLGDSLYKTLKLAHFAKHACFVGCTWTCLLTVVTFNFPHDVPLPFPDNYPSNTYRDCNSSTCSFHWLWVVESKEAVPYCIPTEVSAEVGRRSLLLDNSDSKEPAKSEIYINFKCDALILKLDVQ